MASNVKDVLDNKLDFDSVYVVHRSMEVLLEGFINNPPILVV